MYLWIVLLSFSISLGSTKDFSDWFVLDLNVWDLDEKTDFLADENLFKIPHKETTKTKPASKKESHAQTALQVKRDNEKKHDEHGHTEKVSTDDNTKNNGAKKELDKTQSEKEDITSPQGNSDEDWVNDEPDCDEEKDEDRLFKSEELIPVETKPKRSHTNPVIKSQNANLSEYFKHTKTKTKLKLNIVGNQNGKSVSPEVRTVRISGSNAVKNSNKVIGQSRVTVNEASRRKDLEIKSDSPITEITENERKYPEPSERKQTNVQSNDNTGRIASMRDEERDPNSDDVIFNSDQIDDGVGDDGYHRSRRDLDAAEVEASGDNYGFEMTEETKKDLKYKLKLNITLETPYNGSSLPDNVTKEYAALFKIELGKAFQNVSGVLKIDVENVYLDENRRIKANYNVWVYLNGIEPETLANEERLEILLDNLTSIAIPNVNNITINLDPVYNISRLDPGILNATLYNLITDPCQAEDPCPDGYDQCHGVGFMTGECTHKCYTSNLTELCQHGAECQLSESADPFCNCGKGYTGLFCEKNADEQTSLTTPEIVGVSIAAVVVVLALLSCCIFLLCCRRTKDKNLEYTYFGDEDQPLEGHSDQGSFLGARNVYIDRPLVSIAPLDIYSFTGSNPSSSRDA